MTGCKLAIVQMLLMQRACRVLTVRSEGGPPTRWTGKKGPQNLTEDLC